MLAAFLTVGWPPIAGCPSRWSLHAPAGGRRVGAGHSASLCCRWWSPRPGGERLASGTGSLQNRREGNRAEIREMFWFKNYHICLWLLCLRIVILPSIAGMSPWSMALLVKGAFCSTTANRGGMRDCRADRNTCSLCSSRPCSPCCWHTEDSFIFWCTVTLHVAIFSHIYKIPKCYHPLTYWPFGCP